MKIPRSTWIMAVDGSKMRLLRNEGDARKPVLRLIAQQAADNPRSGLQGADRPGRSFSSASPRRSSLNETDWHEEGKKDFAKEALGVLALRHKEQGGNVIVLAAPSVLGDLRKHCPPQLKPAIVAEIGKDVVNHSPEKIAALIDSVDA